MSESKLYGVSFGNGNDGVSQLYPDFYVTTDSPWRLATCGIVSAMKEGVGQAWAQRNAEIDGESDYTIYATLPNPPCDDSPDGEYPDLPEGVEYEDSEDGRNWQDTNGAWIICEVFPVEQKDKRDNLPEYESIESAFSESVLSLVPAEKED